MSKKNNISRREFLYVGAMTAAGAAIAACQPQTVIVEKEKIVKETVEVEKVVKETVEVEKVVKETIEVEKEKVVEKEVTKVVEKEKVVTATPLPPGKEAPVLTAMVEAGHLPPLEERLPSDPRMMWVFEEIGEYGGTWRRAYKGVADAWGPVKLKEEFLVEWDKKSLEAPTEIAPNFCTNWEQNDDATEWTFYLRKGIKWSDGEGFDTDDVRFWYEDVFMNDVLTPHKSKRLMRNDQPMEVEIIDQYTFKCKFAAPHPMLLETICSGGAGLFWEPEHYMKNFHQEYADPGDLDGFIGNYGVASWDQLWGEPGPVQFWFLNPDKPILGPWYMKRPPPAEPCIMDRNPFYWQADEEGNQLPYADRIEHRMYKTYAVLETWLLSGQIDAQGRHVFMADYSLMKANEAKGNYKTLDWRRMTNMYIAPNYTCPDPVLRELFWDIRFRHAISVAIDREEITELIWDGRWEPRQVSPAPSQGEEYDEEWAYKWIEHDPDTADALLDEMGLTERDSEGFRLRPDGKRLSFVCEAFVVPGSPDEKLLMMAAAQLEKVGIEMIIKLEDRALWESRNSAGETEFIYVWTDTYTVWGGTPFTGSWSPMALWGEWFTSDGASGQEPPADHPIREVWALWTQTQQEGNAAKRQDLFKQMCAITKENIWEIGVVGNPKIVFIRSNRTHNVPDEYLWWGAMRDQGLFNPQQVFIRED